VRNLSVRDLPQPIAVSPESSPIELKGRGANGIAIADGKVLYALKELHDPGSMKMRAWI
jgi:hypothetical protein